MRLLVVRDDGCCNDGAPAMTVAPESAPRRWRRRRRPTPAPSSTRRRRCGDGEEEEEEEEEEGRRCRGACPSRSAASLRTSSSSTAAPPRRPAVSAAFSLVACCTAAVGAFRLPLAIPTGIATGSEVRLSPAMRRPAAFFSLASSSPPLFLAAAPDDGGGAADPTKGKAIGVGIDLGTTFSAVAYLDCGDGDKGGGRGVGDVPRIVPVPGNGGGTVPSVVSYEVVDAAAESGGDGESDEEKFDVVVRVGREACDMENAHVANADSHVTTYRNVKRVIGTGGRISDDVVAVVPHLVANPSGKTYKKDTLANRVSDAEEYPTLLAAPWKQRDADASDADKVGTVRPETVSSEILRLLKGAAERHTGRRVDRAVIGVPARFHDAQMEATKAAAEMAGISKVRLLREPEAAALAYGIGKRRQRRRQGGDDENDGDDPDELVLVFDLGGGTYDVSVLVVGGGVAEIVSTSGDANLGGSDFDAQVATHCRRLIVVASANAAEKSKGQSSKWSEDAENSLLLAAERIRIHLSNNRAANLALPLDPEAWVEMGDASDVILPNDYVAADEGGDGFPLPEDGMSNSTHVLCRFTRKAFERLCGDEFLALLRPIREVCIMAGALLPGDSSPTSALMMEDFALAGKSPSSLDLGNFYEGDGDGDGKAAAAVGGGDDDSSSDGTDPDVLVELRQKELELTMREAKRAQQKGRKRARDVAKRERNYRAEKRKLEVEAATSSTPKKGKSSSSSGRGGGTGGGSAGSSGSKVRDGITGRPISRVVLVGGATRMPAVGRIIEALTGVVPQKTVVNAEEAVALGCAVHAGILDGVEGMGTVLNPMQAAILRAVAEKEGLLDDDFDDKDFEVEEYY